MKPTRYEPERHNVAMVAHPEGRFILYADAEKWMREKEDQLKYDQAWYLLQVKGLKEQIAALINEGQEAACINNHNVEVLSQEVAKKDGEIAKACVIIAEGLKIVGELEGQIAALKAEPKEQYEQSISIIHDQGAENILLKEQIATLKIFIAGLKSLVDGASDVVEIYPVGSPAQKEWRDNWLKKAREVLK